MTYTVASNDSLPGIAQRFQIPLDELLAYNGLTPNSRIFPGMVIVIPPRPPISIVPPTRIYMVRRGDTIWSIARMFRVRVRDIMFINGLQFPVVFPGQRLLIPAPITPF